MRKGAQEGPRRAVAGRQTRPPSERASARRPVLRVRTGQTARGKRSCLFAFLARAAPTMRLRGGSYFLPGGSYSLASSPLIKIGSNGHQRLGVRIRCRCRTNEKNIQDSIWLPANLELRTAINPASHRTLSVSAQKTKR